MGHLLTKNNSGRSKYLADYDVAFLEHLKAEGETQLGPAKDAAAAAARKAFEDIKKLDREGLTKAHVYELDRALVEMASEAELRAEAPALYERYCHERGEPIDPSDVTLRRPTPGQPETVVDIETLRGRVLQILRGLHWSYTFGPLREKERVGLIIEAMVVMLVATAALAATLGILSQFNHPFFAVLATVVYAGVMGGAVSCTRRLGAVPTKGDALGSIYALKNSHYVLYFAPLTGAVFAVVAMLLFMGQILKGLLFPEFQSAAAAGAATGAWQFTSVVLPASSKDYALLFLWCFVAGFAERFVPDTISELAERATNLAKQERAVGATTIAEGVVVSRPARPAEGKDGGTAGEKPAPTPSSPEGESKGAVAATNEPAAPAATAVCGKA